jgi:hypothetical protein
VLAAKLNCVSRSAKFIATLLDARVEFRACGMPGAAWCALLFGED